MNDIINVMTLKDSPGVRNARVTAWKLFIDFNTKNKIVPQELEIEFFEVIVFSVDIGIACGLNIDYSSIVDEFKITIDRIT